MGLSLSIDLAEDFTDAQRIIERGIEMQDELRHRAEGEFIANAMAQKAARSYQDLKGSIALGRIAHDGKTHVGALKVGRHGDTGDGDKAQAGVLHLVQNDFAQNTLNFVAYLIGSFTHMGYDTTKY